MKINPIIATVSSIFVIIFIASQIDIPTIENSKFAVNTIRISESPEFTNVIKHQELQVISENNEVKEVFQSDPKLVHVKAYNTEQYFRAQAFKSFTKEDIEQYSVKSADDKKNEALHRVKNNILHYMKNINKN